MAAWPRVLVRRRRPPRNHTIADGSLAGARGPAAIGRLPSFPASSLMIQSVLIVPLPHAIRGTLVLNRLAKCGTPTSVGLDALPHRIICSALNWSFPCFSKSDKLVNWSGLTQVDVGLNDASFARSVVPSGTSMGIYEAVELRDEKALITSAKLSTSSHG